MNGTYHLRIVGAHGSTLAERDLVMKKTDSPVEELIIEVPPPK
jgi:hypothetical protein